MANTPLTPMEIASAYVRSRVQEPALTNSLLSKEIRRKVQHSEIWLGHFQRVGDLLAYLKRFNASKDDPIYLELKKLNLRTFEDIVDEFEQEFSLWSQDCTRASDFVIGENYSAYQILIFAGSYDIRAGGMFVLESGDKPSAVIIKATLDGGRYPNAWLSEPNELKYYLKSINNIFGEHFKPNAAILNNPLIPILTFVRRTDSGPFTYQGIFNYRKMNRETDGSKWFTLHRAHQQPLEVSTEAEFIMTKLENEVRLSSELNRGLRLARIRGGLRKPAQVKVISTAFIRNSDVVAEVLYRANGVCEGCMQRAPFNRRTDSSPYLEVHHRIPLAENGDDTIENAIALCPNCHRKAHFG
jgi:5-methylcytosine-specific restriction protein A